MKEDRTEKKIFTAWLRRALVRSALVVVLIAVMVFLLIRLTPGDPAVMALGEHATEDSLQALRQRLGLDLSLPGQLLHYAKNLFARDMGLSIKYGVSCGSLVRKSAPVTLMLTLMSVVICFFVTVPLAYVTASRKMGPIDHAARLLPAFTQGMPAFWLGLLLIQAFAVKLRLFPVGGLREGFGGMVYSLILPAITVSFGQIPPLLRSLRERFAAVLASDYILTLRAARLPRRRIFLHALRNAAVPTLMLFSVNLSYMLGGSLVVEQVFSLRGMGKLLFEAVGNRDFPLVQAVALYTALTVALVSLLTDFIAHRIDPGYQL